MFFLIPVAVDHPMRRWPVITFILLGLNSAVYLLSLVLFLAHGGERDPVVEGLALVPAAATPWAYLTYQFAHGGLFHWAGNMVYLYLFGVCVEDLLGRFRFALFYPVTGVLAGLAQVLFTLPPDAEVPIVGASGAISACLGAFVVALPRTRINFRYFGWLLRPFSGDFWVQAWVVVSCYFGSDLLFLLLDLTQAQGGGGVALAAHVGGLLAGAGTMWIARRRLAAPEPESPTAIDSGGRSGPSTVEDRANLYVLVEGSQMGPYSRAQVRSMAQLGSLPPETHFWQEGMAEWRPLAELGP